MQGRSREVVSLADAKNEFTRNLTKAQKIKREQLLSKFANNPELIEWLQLELLDKQGYISYTPNVSTDRILGEYNGISMLIQKLNARKASRNVSKEDDYNEI